MRFFSQLSPKAERSILSPLSRREMSRRLWPDEESSLGRHYGLGTISGGDGDWRWFGHSGGFQGVITRTAILPEQGFTISVLTNAVDGLAHPWLGWGSARLTQAARMPKASRAPSTPERAGRPG